MEPGALLLFHCLSERRLLAGKRLEALARDGAAPVTCRELVARLLDASIFPPSARPALDRLAESFAPGAMPDADRAKLRESALSDLERIEEQGRAVLADHLLDSGPDPSPVLLSDITELRLGPKAGGVWGPFFVHQLVGEGAFGTVWRATDQRSNREVAIKVLSRGTQVSKDDCELFRREGTIAQRLRHPHIVRVHEVGEHGALLYLSMEYLPGRSLTAPLETMGYFPPMAATRIAAQICLALAYAHAEKVIHRDLKPSNVLVARERIPMAGVPEGSILDEDLFSHVEPIRLKDGPAERPHVYLADFGIAKSLRAGTMTFHTATGSPVGTMSYMSPEAADGDKANIGPASDIYSLGATLYHLVTGRPPFPNAHTEQEQQRMLDRRIREGEPPSPCRWVQDLPEGLERIISKAMRKNIQDRYLGTMDLFEDLIRFARGEPVSAPNYRNPRLVTRIDPADEAEMALVPEGDYWIGSDVPDERPRHRVRLSTFWIDVHPVTVEQYDRFLHALPAEGHHPDWCRGEPPDKGSHVPKNWPKVTNSTASLPVTGVDWWDACAYARWAGKRLCTEAEWETACRAGSDAEYAHGRSRRELEEYAWFDANSGGNIHPVEEKLPNVWGLYDMHGNVAEWCEDWFREGYDPRNAENPRGPREGRAKVHRGGSYSSAADDLRCSCRKQLHPKKSMPILGFRCAKDSLEE